MIQNNLIIGSIIALLLIVAIGAFVFVPDKEKAATGEYDTFAQCLYDSGMRMYGSATCSFCERQRQMFGTSFEHIREIECDPRNPMPQTERCIARNIEATPTWIRENPETGETLHRFEPGVVQLERLAEVSGCPLVKDAETVTEAGDSS